MPYNPKKGQDNYASWFAGPGGPLSQEQSQYGSSMPSYWDAWHSARNAADPSQTQATIDRFRNLMLDSASRSGLQGALGVRWGGGGSGSQEAMINNAYQGALSNIGNFAANQYSPEMALRRFGVMQGLFQPNFMNQSQQFSAARKGAHTPPGGGFLGGLLGGAAQYAGMGGFGNPFGGGGGGGGGFGGGGYSLGSGGFMNYQPTPLNFGNGGYSTRLPVTY